MSTKQIIIILTMARVITSCSTPQVSEPAAPAPTNTPEPETTEDLTAKWQTLLGGASVMNAACTLLQENAEATQAEQLAVIQVVTLISREKRGVSKVMLNTD